MRRHWVIGGLLTFGGAGLYAGLGALLPLVAAWASGTPSQINHQGVVAVNGVRFTGTGSFKFAIFDPDTGLNRWTNDGTGVGGTDAPVSAVSLAVADGVYSVRLGDTSITHMNSAIPASIFSDDNLRLRIWFDDGLNGSQQLAPDHVLTGSPYCFAVADGVVGTAQLADGSVTTAKLAGGVGIPAGVMVPFGGSAAPSGWLLCDGSAVSRTTYAALFAALGTTYGPGDGSTTFNVPDLRGRVAMGGGTGAGGGASGIGKPSGGTALSGRTLGGWGGAETHTLTVAEMPAHNHSINDPGHFHNPQWLGTTSGSQNGWIGSLGSVGIWATSTNTTGISINNSGGGGAHNNVQPFTVANYIVKY